MIKVKDGYAKLIGTTASGSASRVLLSNGGDHVLGNASGNIPLNNGTVNTNLNADMLDGLHIHTGRNNEANKVVRTDASGYILAGWINTTSGDMGTTAATRIYCSNDGYIRYKTPANFFSVLTNSDNLLSITVGDQNRKVTVAYATSSGNSDTLDNYHANSFIFHLKYSSLSALPSGADGWYKVGSISDTSGSACIFVVRAYAHSSAIFTVSKGYSTSGNITVLQYCNSGNGSYAYVKGARLISDGTVEILLNKPSANNSTYVNISVAMYNADNIKPLTALTLDTGSPTVIQTKTFTNDSIAATTFVGNLSGNATSATQVIVNLHTANNTEYPLVWSNSASTSTTTGNLLYKSYSHLTYNPSAHRISTGQYIANNSSGPHFTANSTAGNWAYLRLNNGSTYWDIATRSDSGSGGLWLARLSGADNGIFVSTGNNVGISTSSPSYKLHVAGDAYATGWSRAGSGFYVEGKGVHYMSNNASGLGQIYLTSNEFNWSASGAALYFNYRASANGTTVTSYTWNAGSSGSYASHTLGALTSRGDLTLYGLTQTCNKANDAGYMNSALLIREYNFGGSQSDTWAIAPRLSWHWSGRVLTLIGLASGGDLYLSKNNFTNAYLLLHLGNSSISDYNVKIGGTTKLFVRDWGHGAANMNAVARGGRSSMGMAELSTPSGGTATAVNPNGGTSWHHFINIAYTDGGAGSNSWITQIANKAGTTDLWVRSRSGGTISDTANWTAGWTRILTGTNYSSVLDGRYYTESEADSRFVNVTGDTMTGNLTMSTGAAIHLWDDSASTSHRLTLRNTSDIGRIYNYTGSAYGAMYLGHDGTNAIVITSGLNVGIGVSPTLKLHVNGNAMATNLGVNALGGGNGISLYNGVGNVGTYGIAFNQTSNWGTHGYVTGDWATYFTMNNLGDRGWIFRAGSNRFSIDGDGHAYANGLVNANYFVSRVATGTQPYQCTSTTCNTNLNADMLDGYHAGSFGIWRGNIQTDPEADDTTYTTTASFLSQLHSRAAIFNSCFGAFRGSWYYVGNVNYNTGVGTLEMAGTAVLNISANTTNDANYKTLLFVDRTGYLYSYVSQESGVATWSRYAKTSEVPNPANYYWANIKVSASSSTSTSPTFATATMARGVVGGYNNTSYALSTASFICLSWVRTTGSTGWYNESYGGGWYMTDSTWIRNYNSKPTYLSVSTYPSLVCNAQGGSEANIRFEIAGVNKGYTGYKTGYGTFLWNSTASKYVYINDSGYFYTLSYINVGAGNEKNASNPPYVWGVNGSDNFMRTYATSSLSVNYASSAGSAGSSGYIWANSISNLNSPTTWSSDGSRLVYDIYSGSASNKPVSVDNANGLVTFFKSKHGTSNLYVSLFAFPDHSRFYFRYAAAGSWGSWYTVAFTSDIPTVTNYYWANVKVSASSSTSTYPTFANMKSTGRIYAGEWIEFSGNTGLYWPNTYGAHFYPNNTSTYGQFKLLGTKGDYSGILFGSSTSFLTVMSTATHHGLYHEGGGIWEFYYNSSSKGVGIRTSSITKNFNVSGQSYLSSNTWIGTTSGSEMLNVGGWVGTTGATGWYNISYGGGIYMEDSTWVRLYNNKKFYVNNSEASAIHSAGGVYVAGAVHSYANYLKSTCNGKTITIGSLNASYCHYSTDAPSHWFNKPVYVQGHVYGGSSYNRRLAYVDELPTNTWRPIHWAVYLIFHGTASNVSFSKKAGNHNFFTSGSTTFYRDTQLTIVATITYPSGWDENTTMIFGNGAVSNTSDYYKPCILTIQKEYGGTDSRIRFIMSDDSTVENRACYAWVYFLCIG